MREYSEDVNLYIETNSPIDTKVLPTIAAAQGKYNRIAAQLENLNSRHITDESLESDYQKAVTVFENYIVTVYRILSGKGYLTQDEWELMLNNISDSRYIFPDVVLKLGTTKPWTFKGSKEEVLKTILKKKGFYHIRILPSSEKNFLFDNPTDFVSRLRTSFAVNMTYADIENDLNGRNYIKTRQRFNYITIYDFLKFHLNVDGKPSQEELIHLLETCRDKTFANIKNAKAEIKTITGDFWAEYERYRESKVIASLVYWFSKSSTRYLAEDVYEYFSNQIDESLFKRVLSELKVHTAVLRSGRTKMTQKGNSVTFYNFGIEDCRGDIYATVESGTYAEVFSSASVKMKLTSPDSFTVNHLTYTNTYYVSLWEVFNDGDALKLGNLKAVTPGVEWPKYDYTIPNGSEKNNDFQKLTNDENLTVSFSLQNSEGEFSFAVCCQEGRGQLTSPKKGRVFVPETAYQGDFIKCSLTIPDLKYNQEYTIAVFVMMKGNDSIFAKLLEVYHLHKKISAVPVVRKSYGKNEIFLDFAENEWPSSFGKNDSRSVVIFACRTDRFPDSVDDGMKDYTIKSLDFNGYRQGIFKVQYNGEEPPAVLYICGWLSSPNGKIKLVVKNAIYEIFYDIRHNVLTFGDDLNPVNDLTLPKLNFYGFDWKNRLVVSEKNAVIDPQTLQMHFSPSGRVRYVIVEASDMIDRQIYLFRHSKSGAKGKVKIGWFS